MAETEVGLEGLIEQRRRKLDALAPSGAVRYPNAFRPDTSIAEFMHAYGNASLAKGERQPEPLPRHRLAGRVMAVNSFGKAAFIRIQDDSSDSLCGHGASIPAHGEAEQGEPQTGLLQAYVRQENLSERGQAVRANLDIGDLVYLCGTAMRTKTGELTLLVDELDLACKALRPLPEKWHGLSDVETRYRQRYLDLIVHPEVRRVFRLRAQVIAWLRAYLVQQSFLEVETPMMQAVPGGAAAKPFVTRHHALGCDLYLRIAPELYLKRLVVGGFARVFEINRNFRNEGVSSAHNPEFTMLEFYQAYAGVTDMMAHAEAMLQGLARDVLQRDVVTVGEHEVRLAGPYAKMTMRAAIAAHGGPNEAELHDPADVERAVELAGLERGKSVGHGIASLFEHYAERRLIQPTFITDFPRAISPLARSRDDDADTVERFELFVGGRELANAFSELNDPAEQRRRFAEQQSEREGGNDEAQRGDEDYLVALEHGLPPTGGFGMGIDRLLMVLTGAASIRDVLLFPQMRPER